MEEIMVKPRETQNPSELKGASVLVTGGAGFIGSHIVDKLSPDNKVIVLDNLSSGSLSNLGESKSRITFIEGDVLDKAILKYAMSGVEYVFHLAADVGNMKSIEDPYFNMDVNIRGMINLLEACRGSNVKRVVYSSSSAVFGEAKYLPIDEDHPLNPESPYGVSKLAAEKYCFAYHKVHGIPAVALRYFNVYGPRQGSGPYANAVPIFLGRIGEGKPLTVFGDGKATRDFVFVEDVVEANILAATRPEAVGQIFNISTGKTIDVNELIGMFRQITGREVPIAHADARAGEVRDSQADIRKAQKMLGYVPRIDFREGLRLTWEETK